MHFSQLLLLLTLSVTASYARGSWKKRTAPFQISDGVIGDLKTKTLINSETSGSILLLLLLLHCTPVLDEYATIIVDFGGRVEELALSPVSLRGSKRKSNNVQQVLLSHNGDVAAIKENTWWKGMFLVPWANRIAYVSYSVHNNSPLYYFGVIGQVYLL